MVLTNDGVKNQEMIEKCAQVLNKAKRVVIFSGAGMSAESGIGTFRGGSGLWTGMLGKVVLGWFGTPVGWKWTPQFAWSKYVEKFYNEIRDAKPNAGHYAITDLATIFPNTKIVTQNVDGLHQDAGFDPDSVFEVHGTVRKHRCITNGHPYADLPKVLPTTSPKCKEEGCGSTLRPDCVLFTESLPGDQWDGSERSVRNLQRGDVMIIVGTSANVYPAAHLPQYASSRGAHLIDCNLVPTAFQSLDNYHFLEGPSGVNLPALVKRVKQLRGIEAVDVYDGIVPESRDVQEQVTED